MKRTAFVYPTAAAFSGVTSFRPFTIGYDAQTFVTPSYVRHTDTFCSDLFSFIGACYAYNRGGIRFKVFDFGTTSPKKMSLIRDPIYPDSTIYNDTVNVDFGSYRRTGNNVYSAPPLDGGTNVDVPHYNENHSRLCRPACGNTTTQLDLREPVDSYSSKVRIGYSSIDSTTPSNLPFARSVSDDFAFGFFLCTPLTVANGTTPN